MFEIKSSIIGPPKMENPDGFETKLPARQKEGSAACFLTIFPAGEPFKCNAVAWSYAVGLGGCCRASSFSPLSGPDVVATVKATSTLPPLSPCPLLSAHRPPFYSATLGRARTRNTIEEGPQTGFQSPRTAELRNIRPKISNECLSRLFRTLIVVINQIWIEAKGVLINKMPGSESP